jgi:hypothetical protein
MHLTGQLVVPGSFLGPGDHPTKSSTSPSANNLDRGVGPICRFGTRTPSGLSARVPNSLGPTFLSLAVQELKPLNNQAGPLVPENRPGPHQ